MLNGPGGGGNFMALSADGRQFGVTKALKRRKPGAD
jgi:hypothetical protein